MESRNIWNAASYCLQKVRWQPVADGNEWQFIGDPECFWTRRAQEIIDAHLSGQKIYLVNGRHQSVTVDRHAAAREVAKVFGMESIFLCDFSFDAFIEFNPVGVLRRGARSG